MNATLSPGRLKAFRIQCLERDMTMAAVGRELGVSRNAIYRVLTGRSRSKSLEEALSERFPEVIDQFPFHVARVPRADSGRNCAPEQESKPHTGRRSRTSQTAKAAKRNKRASK